MQDVGDARSIRGGGLQGGAEHRVRAAALPVHGCLPRPAPGLAGCQELGHILHCKSRVDFSSLTDKKTTNNNLLHCSHNVQLSVGPWGLLSRCSPWACSRSESPSMSTPRSHQLSIPGRIAAGRGGLLMLCCCCCCCCCCTGCAGGRAPARGCQGDCCSCTVKMPHAQASRGHERIQRRST